MGRYDNLAGNGMFNYAVETKENGPLSPYKEGQTVTKVVRILNRFYQNSDTGFGIYQVEDHDRLFVVKGTFPTQINMSGYYEMTGRIIVKDGEKQLDVSEYKTAYPTDRDGIVNVLKTLHGLDTKANRLYDICGPAVLEQLKTSPETVAAKMKGLGFSEKMIRGWHEQLTASDAPEEALRILLGYGVKASRAKKLLDENGIEIAQRIKKNPYLLMSYIDGLSFIDCDNIALRDGYRLDGIDRVQEAVKYGLRAITQDKGHTCATQDAFVRACRHYSGHPVSIDTAQEILKEADARGENETIVYTIGANNVNVDVKALRRAIQNWRSGGRRRTFAYSIYKCPNTVLTQATNNLFTTGAIVCDRVDDVPYYRLSNWAEYERKIASVIKSIRTSAMPVFSRDAVTAALDKVLTKREQETGRNIELEPEQEEAILEMCSGTGGVYILTGPAGSGKTFVLGLVVDVLRILYSSAHRNLTTQVLAPTGKAAKVAERSTKLQAATIHRFIGRTVGGRSIEKLAELFVVDEFSMVDEELFAGLLNEVPSASKLILMGDIEQLASIGPGACLKDLIESEVVPCIRLKTVKRQSGGSGILINANRIINGQMVKTERVNPTGDKNNAYVIPENDPVVVREKLVALARKAGLSRLQNEGMQVLCPKKRGETGTYAMNYAIQHALNPYREGPDGEGKGYDRVLTPTEAVFHDADGEEHTERLYLQVYDRVIHVVNDYNILWYQKDACGEFRLSGRMGIMNGETGVIERIYIAPVGNGTVRRIVVRYGNEYVFYDGEMYDEIQLAYAITIHKSQGSQWPVVLCPIMGTDYSMLTRQLLYTMYTRAEETCCVVGSLRAIESGICNVDQKTRKTLLQHFLRAA